ncbi:MAG: hypothetical protein NVSMB14_14570 [Isosphaeraceae bacterium]
MSTAGKVLSILVALAFMGWLVLFAGVAEYNRNWGAKDAEQRALLEGAPATKIEPAKKSLKDRIEDARDEYQDKLRAIDDEASAFDRKFTEFQMNQADFQKLLTELRESLERYRTDLENAQVSEKEATATLDLRVKERDDLQTQFDALKADVNKDKAANEELLAQLTDLREKFAKTFAENKKLVKQILDREKKPPLRQASRR